MEWIRSYENNSSASKFCVYTISKILSYKENRNKCTLNLSLRFKGNDLSTLRL